MNVITSELPSVVCMLSAQLRTSKLWIQYVLYVDIMKLFIYAERTSDWYLYLYASESMLNLFVATGHFHYAKACRIYVQQMRALSSEQPDLLEHFVNGKQSIRRSDRLWASLSSDHVIEQTLMKSVKLLQAGTEDSTVSSLICDRWLKLSLETLSISSCLNH